MPHISHHRLAFVLAVVVALGPFALDAYLPAFLAIADDLGTSTARVGLTLSIYVIAMAAGQLIGGPLSDRFGRMRIMFGGLAIFFIGSVLVVFSNSLATMLLGRIVQAFGGGWSTVGVPAMVRDRTEGNETARLFSLIAMIMFAAPAIAPSLGTALLALSGWRSVFVFLALYAVLAAVLMKQFLFPEGEPARDANTEPLYKLITNYMQVLRHREAMRYIAMQSLVLSVMLVYLTHAPFIYQEWLGFSNAGFSALFAFNVAVMMGFSIANRRLLEKHKAINVLAGALGIQFAAIVLLLAVALLDLPELIAIPALAVTIGSMGAIAPNNMAGALQYFGRLAGTAAALMGATQFAIGGAVGSLSTVFAAEAIHGAALTMAVCSLLALILVVFVRRSAARQDAGEAGVLINE